MANRCSNMVKLTGPSDKVLDLWKRINTHYHWEPEGLKYYFLNALYPLDEDSTVAMSLSNWCTVHWGTRREVYDSDFSITDNNNGTSTIVGEFWSYVSPPFWAYDNFLDLNKEWSIEGSFFELGNSECGIYKDGEFECTDDSSSPLHLKLSKQFGYS